MELKFALLCDWAAISREGKLVVAGEFDRILSPVAPVVHTRAYLVLRLHANVAEGTKHKLDLRVIGPEQQRVQHLKSIQFPFVARGPGRPLRGQAIILLHMLELPTYGSYHFEIRVDSRLIDTVPWELRKLGGG